MAAPARESIPELLEMLYPGRGQEIDTRLQAILREFREKNARVQPERAPFFSEKEAILICYADHVLRPGEKSLQTLSRFLNDFVTGSIPAIHVLPFYPYSSDDGFSVIDYLQVREGFGDWDDVERISDSFELMVDLVINHISARSDWFQGFLRGDSRYEDHFIAFDRPVDVSSVFRPRTYPLLTRFETENGQRFVWTTFSDDQIDVNFANPDVLLEYLRILLFYVEHGASIIRLDAIAFLWKELGTRCLHLPETHAVVRLMRQVLEDVAPNVWIITETNVPHEENISYFGSGDDEAHLVYNFALPPLLLYSFLKGDATQLTRWAATLAAPSEKTTFFNFTASHDGIGVTALRAMVSPDELERVLGAVEQRGGRVSYRSVPGQDPVPYELNIVYLDALGGPGPFLASQAIALSLQGVPGIYFNSLIGARNWNEGLDALGYNRAINREKFGHDRLVSELTDPQSEKHRIFRAYTRMLQVRGREPLFSPLASQRILELHPSIFAVLRENTEDRLLALVNVGDRPVRLDGEVLATHLGNGRARDLLSETNIELSAEVSVPDYGVLWLK